ncbi:hypothetical protein D7D52_12190 [Nocardia yunnanensis]|uniref:Uncharacterized protein n=1 Tax=Nocardia yunnanensis TaxID=2382165 RepID=A0A386ZBF2_9NOCA|nr:hypothetical protein [Nocardia yunnanensis]AYF74493.1 hypothetical protein D7D52_12190 [Nocardia yunnanensis]
MNLVVITYMAYTIVSLAVTFWVARVLHRTGARFLVDVMNGDRDLAEAVNHLLVIGFWLVNAGFVALALRISVPVEDGRVAIEELAMKLGRVLLVLGGMHFANLIALNKIRRGRHKEQQAGVPPMVVDAAQLA